MRHKNISLDVLVNGNPTTEYSKDGNRYIEGRKGSEYTLRIKNHTGDKILFVPTIDGLSVLNSKPGHYDSPGYILGPYETYEITGWRTDLQHTRKFEFVRHSKSYAKKLGESTDNLGVIGLMAFKEAVTTSWVYPRPMFPSQPRRRSDDWPQWPRRYDDWPQWTNKTTYSFNSSVGGAGGGAGAGGTGGTVENATGAGAGDGTGSGGGGSASGGTLILSASLGNRMADTVSVAATRAVNKSEMTSTCDMAMPQATVGTGMGSEQQSVVQTAYFERQPLPFSTISVYYYERKQLEQMGVTRKVQRKEHMPQAFPAADSFCRQV